MRSATHNKERINVEKLTGLSQIQDVVMKFLTLYCPGKFPF